MYHYDWIAIRAMWEAGESAYGISQKDGMPTRQAICDHALSEGWERVDEVDKSLELIPFEGLTLKQQIVVRELAKGLPIKHAAAIAGVDPGTVTNWRNNVPEFSLAAQAAIGVMAKTQLAKITGSTDWRSGLALLERHPHTREDFAPPNAGRGMIGTTFNVLGHVSVGLERSPIELLEKPDER